MSLDLQKAAASFVAGRRDEALVYAWNALSSAWGDELVELRRLAQKLDDPLLLRELDRRGVPTAPPRAAEPPAAEIPSRGRRARVVGPLVFVGIVLAIIAFGVSQIPTEAGPVRATPKETVEHAMVRRLLTVGSGVYLVPLGNVRHVDVRALADEVAVRYRVRTRTLPALPLPGWTLAVKDGELNGDQLIRLLQLAYAARGRAAIIGITDCDMFSPSLGVHGLFSLRNPPPYAVVSSSSLGATLFDRLRGHDRHERVRKLVARNIGFLYFLRPVSRDPHSLLRSSMSSVGDIDSLDEDL